MNVGNTVVTVRNGVVLWTSGMRIDVDGAPRAYHPNSSSGLDRLANAGVPGDWCGVLTDDGKRTGKPLVQGPLDPAPGFYVSATALQDPSKAHHDPRRYVDASTVPYISIPPELKAAGVGLGDFGVAWFGPKAATFIVADVGPHKKMGEGSPALARLLGVRDDARNGGVDYGVRYQVFAGTSKGWPVEQSLVTSVVTSLLAKQTQG